MKTTIDLPDDLGIEAKAYAARRGMTLRALVELGIRQILRDEQRNREFRLRDASVGGDGLQQPFRDAEWPEIRKAAYEERGG